MSLRAEFRTLATDILAQFGDVAESGTYRVRPVTGAGLAGPTYGTAVNTPLAFVVGEFAEDERFPEPIRPNDWKASFPGEALSAAPSVRATIVRADGSEWEIVGIRNADGIGAWWDCHMTRAQ